jgi:HAE1 family hydrophobic/amphiphilic exporter-1
MASFFINRPIVAMVISILLVVVGSVSALTLPVAQFPDIVPPEIRIDATFVGADAVTVEQSVATPIEQQISGVDLMNYVTSVSANNGALRSTVSFEVGTDPNVDQILTQMRVSQAEPQLPSDVRALGVTVQKSLSSPLMLVAVTSPNGTYDPVFLANYASINLVDPLLRIPGIGSVTVFGAGRYAMRVWVRPDTLARLGITVPQIIEAVQGQNTVNPAGQIGGEPVPPGQEFTYAVRAQGRLITAEEFGEIVVRADPDGSMIRLKDVGRIELGAQNYTIRGQLRGKPAAIVALFQLPGSNALTATRGVRAFMEQYRPRFPVDLDYAVSLDTTRSVTEGIREILLTLGIALALVILVVFVFLQGWRATLIPALAVPVSLIGTFVFFPILGFSLNTLSLFGLVLAIGLVVDDAIVVVEAVERHIEEGRPPKEAALQAMREVSGPVVAIALILSAVFVPTIFIPGITGRLYQQFAVTIAISVVISAFNALSLSPALSALLLRPRREARGPLVRVFRGFNAGFGRATGAYVALSGRLVRKSLLAVLGLVAILAATGILGMRLPGEFLPEEDQGYLFLNVTLPQAASLQRTSDVAASIDQILRDTPGVETWSSVAGFSILSTAQTSYNAFFFVTLKPWGERTRTEETAEGVRASLNRRLKGVPEATAFAFPPPAIQGVGTAGGVTMVLEDRAGREMDFLARNTEAFLEAARKRPELASVTTTLLPTVPQVFARVDREKVLKQGVDLRQVYQTLQTFMGGSFVNFFTRFGRQWQVYVQAEGAYRTRVENVGQFYVRNSRGEPVPLSALMTFEGRSGPEFTQRYNLFRCAQINAAAAPGFSSNQAMVALEQAFADSQPPEMGFDYLGMSFQERRAREGVPAAVIFGLSIFFVFLILAALYESWALPWSVLLGTPVALAGAIAALVVAGLSSNVYAQIGFVMLIGLAAKNAVLIVEFAKREHEDGKEVAEAALLGARIRFRPILMTSFAFILGVLPLVFARGAGAAARRTMGIAVLGGMTAATLLGIFLVPVTFTVVERLAERMRRRGRAHAAPPS